ncbi:ATPase [Candidatus Micrarchaeota archaeon]|nr:ATPase [Candidatus Micrarchaeota archaeon]
MARKKIREYDAKMLVARELGLDLRSIQITAETDFQSLAEEHPWLANTRVVVKPDMLFGKRGKNNLVLLNTTLADAEKFVKERLGNEAEISGVKGPLTHFIMEPFVPHEDEYYLSILSTREGNSVSFSTSGGMDVESDWGKMKTATVPVDALPDEAGLMELVSELPEDKKKNASGFIKECCQAFKNLDFTLLEMNPFTFDAEGNPFPLDMRVELDDTASFKNMKKWNGVEFPQPFGRKLYPEEKYVKGLDEKTGASLKLTVLNPRGRIWTMVAGGGASVIYTDTVADLGFGEELGNYGEYSGNPNEEETYLYAKTILDLATREPDGRPRALLIGGGVANFTDVAKTFKGIIRALKECREKLKEARVRIYVRRGGPNYQTGLELMKGLGSELGVPIEVYGPESSMTRIVPMAIDHVKGE